MGLKLYKSLLPESSDSQLVTKGFVIKENSKYGTKGKRRRGLSKKHTQRKDWTDL